MYFGFSLLGEKSRLPVHQYVCDSFFSETVDWLFSEVWLIVSGQYGEFKHITRFERNIFLPIVIRAEWAKVRPKLPF